ncbi:cutinase family protein [Streptacidiphilus fuscans]|nr:PE-PPE domain-containing protein [Streptacidiphilus fuscans]
MSQTSRTARVVRTAVMTAALAVGTAVAFPGGAQADSAGHVYIEVGGTGATTATPSCPTTTSSYNSVNGALPAGSQAVEVCYPATAGPILGFHGPLISLNPLQVNPDALTAPSYDASEQAGYQAALKAAEDAHNANPGARITITGYSQGAEVADQVLQTIASGSTGIPRSQVDGMLYADPMQPGTGVVSNIPKGLGIPGVATSPGAGPAEFNGIPVARYCIHGDFICDANLTTVQGYFTIHGDYPMAGNVIAQTLAQDGQDGVFWRNTSGGPA